MFFFARKLSTTCTHLQWLGCPIANDPLYGPLGVGSTAAAAGVVKRGCSKEWLGCPIANGRRYGPLGVGSTAAAAGERYIKGY